MSAKKKPTIPQLANSATTWEKTGTVLRAAANICLMVITHIARNASPPRIPVSLNSRSNILCTGNALMRLIIVSSYCSTTVTNEFNPTPRKGCAFTMFQDVEARLVRKETASCNVEPHRSIIVDAFRAMPQVNTEAIKARAIFLRSDKRTGLHERQNTLANPIAAAKPAHPLQAS